jgi:hypothetical protein
MKSRCSKRDKNVNLKLINKFEPLTALEPKIVVQLDKSVNPKASNKKCKRVPLLGSSHARGLNDRLQSVLGSEYAVTSLFKPNVGLRNVTADLKALSRDLTKDDHVIIVGGPENSLDVDRHYHNEKDLNSIAKDSINTNFGFVGLLVRHVKPHMNRRVRSVNKELECTLWTADRFHIDLIDVTIYQ